MARTSNVVVLVSLMLMVAMKGIVTTHAEPSKHHKLLLVSFDCFKWTYFDRVKDMPGFRYLEENGVRAEFMKPVFPSWTSPSHTSIATGLYAESHGVVHNFHYDIDTGDVVHDFKESLAVNEWWDNGQEPIWITASNQGLKSGGYLYPGSNSTIRGKAATRSIQNTASTPFSEEEWRKRVDETISWFKDEDFDFVALYFQESDTHGHEYGPDSDYVNKVTLPLVDRTVQHLFKRISESGLEDDLNVILLSDHGILTLDTSKDAIFVLQDIDPSWISFELCFGPIGLVEPSPGKKAEVYDALKSVSQNMDVYYKEDLPERLHLKNSDRITSIVVIAQPGYSLFNHAPRSRTVIGDHGYDNELEDMKTSYFSIGPSFKEGFSIDGFEVVNVYPLMCHLLGLEPAPNNGSLDTLLPTLKENYSPILGK